MPGDNVFHDAVERGLIKEGWTITAVPYFVQFGGVDPYIDIAAESGRLGTHRVSQEFRPSRYGVSSLLILYLPWSWRGPDGLYLAVPIEPSFLAQLQLHGVDLIV